MRKVSDKTLIKRAILFTKQGSSDYNAVYLSFRKSHIYDKLRFRKILREIRAFIPNQNITTGLETRVPANTLFLKREPKTPWYKTGQYA